ncbi:MAG: QueT transporter family protein [Clostridia bacterium]|nr:QueT transporter family protein [Clostridia bacterium]
MTSKTKRIVIGAMIGALYVVLTLTQSILFPGSTNQAIQFRASEALMMLALFSPTAICGLTVGCCVANIFAGMPPDIIVGSFATLLTCIFIYKTKSFKIKNFPILSLIFPALCNGIIVGAEIQLYYIGGFNFFSFLTQAAFVAIGELAVSVLLGIPLYYSILKTNVQKFLK